MATKFSRFEIPFSRLIYRLKLVGDGANRPVQHGDLLRRDSNVEDTIGRLTDTVASRILWLAGLTPQGGTRLAA